MKSLDELNFDIHTDYFIESENYEVEKVPGTKFGLKKVDNIYLPNYIRSLKHVKETIVEKGDTFVIGVPKSGTTWVEEIVWLLQNDLNFELAKNLFHFARVLFIDVGIPKYLQEMTKSPRVFKSHLPLNYLPDNVLQDGKIVYVIRNPKDIIVSMKNFVNSTQADKFDGTLDQMVENYMQGKCWYGSWASHIDNYVTLPNIFIIKYEEMLEKPFQTTKALSEYLGKKYTDNQIKKVIAFCSFDKMKGNDAFDTKQLVKTNFFNDQVNFFKTGKIGNWQKYLSEDMSKKLDEYVEKNLKNIDPKTIQYLPREEKKDVKKDEKKSIFFSKFFDNLILLTFFIIIFTFLSRYPSAVFFINCILITYLIYIYLNDMIKHTK